jgi:predicted RNA-binding Zn ribbon-like protein
MGVVGSQREMHQGAEHEAWLLEFPFRSGRLCLDFLATLGSRKRLDIERFRTAADLDRWFAGAELGVSRKATEADLRLAIALREAVHRALSAPNGAEADVINSVAAARPLTPVLGADVRTRRWASSGNPMAALSTIARDAIDLLTGPLLQRVRECAGPECTLLFVDTSRPGTRRWCSMDVCGNQAKAEGLRTKRRLTR